MSGKKGRSGKKKSPTARVNEALEKVDENLQAIFEALIRRALDGDREAQIYLIDRRLGKPKAETDVNVKGGEELGAAWVVKIYQLIEARRKELEERVLLDRNP